MYLYMTLFIYKSMYIFMHRYVRTSKGSSWRIYKFGHKLVGPPVGRGVFDGTEVCAQPRPKGTRRKGGPQRRLCISYMLL